MATTTTKQSFPVPSADGSDPPAGHTQIKALGDAIDAKWPVRSKGKSIIATQQQLDNNGGFEFMGTPDRVSGIVLPTDGLIMVLFQAEFRFGRSGITGTPSTVVGLFVGTNQAYIAKNSSPNPNRLVWSGSSSTSRSSAKYGALSIAGGGIRHQLASTAVDYAHNANAQVIGDETGGSSPLVLFAPAGTYDVGVKFDVSDTGADCEIKNRKLWVWSLEF